MRNILASILLHRMITPATSLDVFSDGKLLSHPKVRKNRPIFEGGRTLDLPQQEPRIVGGGAAEKGRYPYSVSILLDPNIVTGLEGDEITICAGTLIAPEWVLSAAHCANLGDRVQIGRHDFSDEQELIEGNFEEIEIDYYVPHPSFDNFTLDFDMMLIKLVNASEFPTIKVDNGTMPVTMNTEFTIMGWGTTSQAGPRSEILLDAEIDPVSFRACNRRYAIYGGLTENMFCAVRNGKDACQGDSGGPLIIKGETTEDDVQIGIISWGVGCGTNIFPGVYTRVGKLFEFIEGVVGPGVVRLP